MHFYDAVPDLRTQSENRTPIASPPSEHFKYASKVFDNVRNLQLPLAG